MHQCHLWLYRLPTHRELVLELEPEIYRTVESAYLIRFRDCRETVWCLWLQRNRLILNPDVVEKETVPEHSTRLVADDRSTKP
ncbi:hypothetical protein V6N11_049394 [Hibiscus sabdariffa]